MQKSQTPLTSPQPLLPGPMDRLQLRSPPTALPSSPGQEDKDLCTGEDYYVSCYSALLYAGK